MSNKCFKVYRHTLRQDGRTYIGQTCLNLKQRAGSNGQRYKHCSKFWNAIEKYGWDAFDHVIIADNLTLEEANILEEQLIREYNSIEEGFNINLGGRNHLWTEEQKLKMRERNLGDKNPNYNKPRTEETKKRIGEANKISQLRKRHSKETKEKMSISHKKDIPILCIEQNIVYSCPSDAAIGIGLNSKKSGHITEACKGRRKTAYGFHWVYINNDENIINKQEKKE